MGAENRVPMMALALLLGRVQAWYAAGYREGTTLEQAAILPCWLLFRVMFVAAFAVAEWLAG